MSSSLARTWTALTLSLTFIAACASPYELTCDDLLPAEESGFEPLAALVVTPNPLSCSKCHNTTTPVRNLNFEGPGVAYDALRTKTSVIYEQVASGAMPLDAPPWSDAELRLLRSWYCHGAPYAK